MVPFWFYLLGLCLAGIARRRDKGHHLGQIDNTVEVPTLIPEIILSLRLEVAEQRIMIGMSATSHILIQRQRAEFRRRPINDRAGHRDAGSYGQSGAAIIGKICHFKSGVDDVFNRPECITFGEDRCRIDLALRTGSQG